MSDPLFRPVPSYAELPPTPPPDVTGYRVGAAPAAAWPTPFGTPGQTSRSGEPLVSDRWSVAWQSPLGDAADSRGLLVGNDAVVVTGAEWRHILSAPGLALGRIQRGRGTCFLDPAGGRLLTDDVEGGLFTHRLSNGERDARVMLSHPSQHLTRAILQGPGVLAFLFVHDSPFGPPANAVVEVVRVRDWGKKGKLGILYGLDPVAGIIREADGKTQAAAAPRGPVLATPDGILWCDWLLRPIAEQRWSFQPRALSVDDSGRAYVFGADGTEARFLIVTPDGARICDIGLPWERDASSVPPLVGPSGNIFLTPPGQIWALDAAGRKLWTQVLRSDSPPGTLTANGVLLISDDSLYAITPSGERHMLWKPPAPLVSPAVLARGQIHVASADTLYVLKPSP